MSEKIYLALSHGRLGPCEDIVHLLATYNLNIRELRLTLIRCLAHCEDIIFPQAEFLILRAEIPPSYHRFSPLWR